MSQPEGQRVTPVSGGSSWASRAIDKVATHPALTVLALEAIALIVLGGVPGGANVVSNNWVAFLSGGVALPVLAKVVQVAVRSVKGGTVKENSISSYRLSEELIQTIQRGGRIFRRVKGEPRSVSRLYNLSTKDTYKSEFREVPEPKEMVWLTRANKLFPDTRVPLPDEVGGNENPDEVEYFLDLSLVPAYSNEEVKSWWPAVKQTVLEETMLSEGENSLEETSGYFIKLRAEYDVEGDFYTLKPVMLAPGWRQVTEREVNRDSETDRVYYWNDEMHRSEWEPPLPPSG